MICSNQKISKWIQVYISNPFKTWWKAKKYFKRPKIHFHFFYGKIEWFSPFAKTNTGKFLKIWIDDIEWKDKFDSPRHEHSPYIYVKLFNRIGFAVTFTIWYKDEFGKPQNGDSYYWEYLLNWLFYQKKKTLKCYSTWVGESTLYKKVIYGDAEDGSEDKTEPMQYVIPCVSMSLTKKGRKKLEEEIYG